MKTSKTDGWSPVPVDRLFASWFNDLQGFVNPRWLAEFQHQSITGWCWDRFLVSVQNDRIFWSTPDLVPKSLGMSNQKMALSCDCLSVFADANFWESLFLCIFYCHVLWEYVWRHLGVDLFAFFLQSISWMVGNISLIFGGGDANCCRRESPDAVPNSEWCGPAVPASMEFTDQATWFIVEGRNDLHNSGSMVFPWYFDETFRAFEEKRLVGNWRCFTKTQAPTLSLVN